MFQTSNSQCKMRYKIVRRSYCSLLELMVLMSQFVDCPISEIQLLEKAKSMILLEV